MARDPSNVPRKKLGSCRLNDPAHLGQSEPLSGRPAQHHLVPVLQVRARLAVAQLERLRAVPAQLQQAAALLALAVPRSCPIRAGRPCAGSPRSRSDVRSAAPGSSTGGARSCVRSCWPPIRSSPWPRCAASPPGRCRTRAALRAGSRAGRAPARAPGTRRSTSASSGVTQAPIEVANDLPFSGPSGTVSQPWMSRALQSFSSTRPNTCSSASPTATGPPRRARRADHASQLELDVQPLRGAEHAGPARPSGTGREAARPACRLPPRCPLRPW